MRAPLRPGQLPAPPQRLTVALIKPGAPRQAIRSRLRAVLREVHTVERELTAADCGRLYPDAYGAGFVAERTAYLTSATVQVLVLAGSRDAVAGGAALKRVVRAELGADPLRNHLHMPDNPAEALADIAMLAGWGVLQDSYQRWESRDDQLRAARRDCYRAYLGQRASDAGMVGPRWRHLAPGHPAGTAWR
jgi:hypothetical protein